MNANEIALEALENIALAGMSPSPEMSDGGVEAWHARQAWRFIGIAARALEPLRKAIKDEAEAVQVEPVACPTCGELEPFTGTCGTSDSDARALCKRTPPSPAVNAWVAVSERLPECDMTPNSFGVQVLVYPPYKSEGSSQMPVAFYGCRQTNEPNFYLFGRCFDPTHWMKLPEAPRSQP